MKHQIFFTPKLTTLGSLLFIFGLGVGVTAVYTNSNDNLYKQGSISTSDQSSSILTDISQNSKIKNSLLKQVKKPDHLNISKQVSVAVPIEPNLSTSIDDDQYEHDLSYNEQMFQMQIQIEKRIDHMDSALKDEDSDINWEYTVQEALYEKLQAEEMSSLELLETECGATMCRLTLSVNMSNVDDMANTALDVSQLWHGAGFYSMDERTGQLLLYIAREGYSLPDTSNI